jgi:hypothetical protein
MSLLQKLLLLVDYSDVDFLILLFCYLSLVASLLSFFFLFGLTCLKCLLLVDLVHDLIFLYLSWLVLIIGFKFLLN